MLWDVVFVIYVIYGSMRDMEIKDSKNMRLQLLEKLQRLFSKRKDFVREKYGDVFRNLEIGAVRQVQKSIEMCLWAAKQQNFKVRKYESGAQKSCDVLYVMV